MKNLLQLSCSIIFSAAFFVTGYAQEKTFNGSKGTQNLGLIPDDGGLVGAEFTCAVSGVGTLQKNFFVRVLLDITHPYCSDLDVTLTSPQGTVLTLFTDVGGAGDNFTQTKLTQTATIKINQGSAPFTGEFLPQEDPGLAKFDGQNADGTWKLKIIDDGVGDQGFLNEWKLVFNTTVIAIPEANFGFTANGLSVTFTDSSSNSPTAWKWDFGDKRSDTIQHPQHTYDSAGSYMVMLISSNSAGSDTVNKELAVSAGGQAPNADFTFTANQLNVAFTDLSSNTPTFWHWDFGDGSFDSLQHPQHVYAKDTIYNVCLVAGNDHGSDTMCKEVILTVLTVKSLDEAGICVYPNPVREQFVIRQFSSEPVIGELFNTYGQRVHLFNLTEQSNRADVSGLPSGYYLLRLNHNRQVISKKIQILNE